MSRRYRQHNIPVESSVDDFVNTAYQKGGTLALTANIRELEQLVIKMKENAHVPLNKIPPALRNDFRKLTAKVDLLKDTEAYHLLWDIIVKHFTGMLVNPHTIGSYCGGCLTLSAVPGSQGCGATCAGSITPNTPDWVACDKSVIVGVPDGSDYSFSVTHRTPGDSGYVFLYKSGHQQDEGVREIRQIFNESDIQRLRQLGLTKVHVFAYDSGDYADLTKAERELGPAEKLALAESEPHHKKKFWVEHHQNGSAWGIFIVITLIIVILLVILARRRR